MWLWVGPSAPSELLGVSMGSRWFRASILLSLTAGVSVLGGLAALLGAVFLLGEWDPVIGSLGESPESALLGLLRQATFRPLPGGGDFHQSVYLRFSIPPFFASVQLPQPG